MTNYIAIAFGKDKNYGVVLPYSDFTKANMRNIINKAGEGLLEILYCGIDKDKAYSVIEDLETNGDDLTDRLKEILSRN